MAATLKLGVSRRIITPKVGCRLYGYTPDTYSESVHDDLTATVFYFVKDDTKALMISATVGSVTGDCCDEIFGIAQNKYQIPKDHCIMHATHTHSGPTLESQVGWGDFDREYYEEIFRPSVLEAIDEAVNNPIAVKMGIASGESLIGINRRELNADNKVILGQNPWGPFDPKMTVISFCDLDGKTVANIVHYGMHGTCAGKNHEISRDWSGVMIDVLEGESGAITAFFNGPEGDVGPRLTNGKTVGGGDITYAERHGALAAADAVRIYRSLKIYSEADLSVTSNTLNVPLDKRVSLEVAKEEYEKYKGNTVNIKGAKANYYKKQIELYETGFEDALSRPIAQTIIRIGGLAFVSFPYELFSEIGMRIAKDSQIPYTLSLSISNGSLGYFVTEDQICRGGYEVEMFKTGDIQPYADNADLYLVKQTLENLKKL